MAERRTIEARTIRDMQDLRDLIDAVLDATGTKPGDADLIRLASPVDFRLVEITLTDGSIVHDLETTSWKG